MLILPLIVAYTSQKLLLHSQIAVMFIDNGKKALISGEEINLKYLEKSETFLIFHNAITSNDSSLVDEEKDESPMEILDAAFQQITATLASQLMDEVMKRSPTEFEKLVVTLYQSLIKT